MQPGHGRPELVEKTARELTLGGTALTALLKAAVAQGACLRFRARGGSMGPFVRNGDVVTVAPLRHGQRIRLGDIVAFEHPQPDNLRLHRVIGRRGRLLLVKGDNTPAVDGLVPEERVLGVVVRIERNGVAVRLGVGRIGALVALLSRAGVLLALLKPLRRLRTLLRRAAPVRARCGPGT